MKRKLRPEDEHRNNSPWNTRAGNEPGESLLSSGDCPRDQKKLIYAMLMRGEKVTYNPDNSAIDMASMFGFVKSRKGIIIKKKRNGVKEIMVGDKVIVEALV